MRNDIVCSLKNSKMLFVRELLGSDPMAVYRWSKLRHLLCAISLFRKAGEARRNGKHYRFACFSSVTKIITLVSLLVGISALACVQTLLAIVNESHGGIVKSAN